VLVALRYAMLRSSYKLPSGFVGSGPPSISAMASSPYLMLIQQSEISRYDILYVSVLVYERYILSLGRHK
jgi:hypothetical protein